MPVHDISRRDFLAQGARAAVGGAATAPLMRLFVPGAHGQPSDKPAARTLRRDGIEFLAIEPGASSQISVVAQCLDNQWVPRPLLREMADQALPLASVTD